MTNKITNEFNKTRMEEERKGFRIHRLVYLCVIGLLITINLTFSRQFIWFVFPMIGWGIGLAVHYMNIKNQRVVQ
ncbi:MAG: hypothetical protein CVU89_06450 [Firmicutes bacterium HGW-Firmicutes-14]|jgi:Mg2+/citrate symporter|nr:MAG: hypothetical protein CVU89_06450 [Firmicutes bacterium HGW-Firmicutes-14]